jgi:NAD(P)-dependent dehydrogenase (short-subunit alcohol dehydrogenase family)
VNNGVDAFRLPRRGKDLPSQAEKAKEVSEAITKLGNGAKSLFVPLDVASEESWVAAMETVEKEMGSISILVR